MNIFNHRAISSRQRQDPLSRRIWNDPYLDWSIMLVCTTILMLVMAFLGYLVYSNTQSALDAPLNPATGAGQASLDAEALQKVLVDFEERSAGRAEIIRGAGVPADPSI